MWLLSFVAAAATKYLVRVKTRSIAPLPQLQKNHRLERNPATGVRPQFDFGQTGVRPQFDFG
jgi:hypothetical protein